MCILKFFVLLGIYNYPNSLGMFQTKAGQSIHLSGWADLSVDSGVSTVEFPATPDLP